MMARLLGFKIVERDENHLLVRLPWFCTSPAMKASVVERLQADYQVKNGEPLEVTVGHRLVRFDGKIPPLSS